MIDKWNFMTLKTFYTAKDTIILVKHSLHNGENTIYTLEKWFTPIIHKIRKNLNNLGLEKQANF